MIENPRGVYYHPESDALFIDTEQGMLSDGYAAETCHALDADSIPAHRFITVGTGYAEVLPDLDFETYSEAGYNYDPDKQKWISVGSGTNKGIAAVGAWVYSEHPSTEVLSLAYNLKDGQGPRLWLPGMAPPYDLFNHILQGGLLEAANSGFEYSIWANVCAKRMGWPVLRLDQLRDTLAKARAVSLPGSLGKVGKVLDIRDKKIDEGKRLLNKFSIPRNPSKKDPRTRIRLSDPDALQDANQLYLYNLGDIKAESEVSACIQDLSADELKMWLLDQKINFHGVPIDKESLDACLSIINQAFQRYTAELVSITDGQINSAGEIGKITDWLNARGVRMTGLKSEDVEEALKRPNLPADARRVLEIRATLGAASVKKLFSINNRLCSDNRVRDIFLYCGAGTGRWAGRGPQPQNFPSGGPSVRRCDKINGCGRYSVDAPGTPCPWCSAPDWALSAEEWGAEAAEDALTVIRYGKLEYVERVFGDAVAAVSGCLRALFMAPPGKDFICSDYSAIEAVVLAALSDEEWRLEVFRTHGKIYEMSASKITGIPFDTYLQYKKDTGQHHPDRKKIGKVAELASGFQGGVGAWKQFGADEFMTDEEIRANIKKWRAESPNIVKFWYGLEEAAIAAVQNPGQCFHFKGFNFGCKDDVLYIQLLSGRKLAYWQPRLTPDVTPWGKSVLKLSYMGVDSKTKNWVREDTYGGKLCENVVQATARDILAHALVKLDAAGYDPALHVHDEIASEVAEGWGTVEEFERIMADMPEWCKDWPIKAAGGWRGKRYRKD